MISGKAKIAAVIGCPVAHSLSPRLHNYWLRKYGIDGAYVPLPVTPEALSEVVRALPKMGFAGCNVTVPHKEKIASLMGGLDEAATAIGAVNTIFIEQGRCIGSNTDAYGFRENLRREAPPAKHMAVVLGAGGAARAICKALLDEGFTRIVIANRTPARAGELAARFGPSIALMPWERRAESLKGADLLVNTTTLGMSGQPALELDLRLLPKTAVVCDLVYAPVETALLKAARENGHRVADGLGMLIHQAVPGFEGWFGVRPEATDDVRRFLVSA